MIIRFDKETEHTDFGAVFKCQFDYPIKGIEYTIVLEAIQKPRIENTYVRYSSIVVKGIKGELRLGVERDVVSKLANIISRANIKFKNSFREIKFASSTFRDLPDKIEVDTETDLLNIEGANESDVKALVQFGKWTQISNVVSSISQLKKMHENVIELITTNANESAFKDLIMRNQNLLPIMFPAYKSAKSISEYKILANEIDFENRIDVVPNTEIIPSVFIELKKSDVKLFNSTNDRENMKGISSVFASAITQCNLYKQRLSKATKDLTEITAYLIVGISPTETNEINSFNLIKLDSRVHILTWTEFKERIESIILFLEGVK